MAFWAEVELRPNFPIGTFLVEVTGSGWLMLVETSERVGVLTVVTRDEGMDLVCSRSEAVRKYAGSLLGAPVRRPAAPTLATPFMGRDWICVGSTGTFFADPLAGTGVSSAIKTARWVSNFARLICADPRRVQEYSQAFSYGLLSAFGRHLQACQTFYTHPLLGPDWDPERAALEAGLSFLKSCMAESA